MRARIARLLFGAELDAAYKRGWWRGMRSGWDQGVIAQREAQRQSRNLYHGDNPYAEKAEAKA